MNDPDALWRNASRLPLGPFTLDLAQGELLTADEGIASLRRQSLELLLLLGRHAGQVVTKDELMHQVWPGVVVGEGSLAQAVADVRRILGDHERRLVRTVARRGYMLVPENPLPGSATPVASMAPAEPSPAAAGVRGPWRRRGSRWFAAGLALVVVAGVAGLMHRPVREGPGAPLSVVVLPLAHAGPPDQAWFADAVHDDLIFQVGRISGVTVISRETAARLSSASEPRELARALDVHWVVGGEVARQGEQIRLHFHLLEGESGRQRWAERFVVERRDVNTAMAEAAQRIARALSVEMMRASGERAARLPAGRVGADDLAMQGLAIYFRGMTPSNLKAAQELFEEAIARDPRSVRAWGGMQAVLGVQAALNWIPRQPAIQRLKEVADHLQSLDQEDFFTYSAKNFIAFLEGDWEALQIGTDAGVRRFPSHPGMHHFRALALAARGHFDECLRDSQRAVRLGPRDTSVGVSLFVEATCHFMREDYAAAAAAARAANQANPSLPSPPVLLAAALQRTGDREGARLAVAEVLRRQPAYRAEDIGNFLRGQHPRFLLGRDRAIASLREAGLP